MIVQHVLPNMESVATGRLLPQPSGASTLQDASLVGMYKLLHSIGLEDCSKNCLCLAAVFLCFSRSQVAVANK